MVNKVNKFVTIFTSAPATVTKSIGLPSDVRACPELAKGKRMATH
jgi:hypothetical protein